jgi:hypothetical protein
VADDDLIDCDVYAETTRDRDELADWLERELGTRFYIDRRDERDPVLAREFPSGFLYFSYVIEAGPQPLVARLLRLLWDAGIPAVAACDYEHELPEAGGYKSRAIPWP